MRVGRGGRSRLWARGSIWGQDLSLSSLWSPSSRFCTWIRQNRNHVWESCRFRHGPKSHQWPDPGLGLWIRFLHCQYDLDFFGSRSCRIKLLVKLSSWPIAAGIEHARKCYGSISRLIRYLPCLPYIIIIYGQLISSLTSLKVQNRPDTPFTDWYRQLKVHDHSSIS